MTAQDKSEFKAYLEACTDAQVVGVWSKEKNAGRSGYASLARTEMQNRRLV